MRVALEIMFMNKYAKRRFVLYLDEFHRVRHIQGVLSSINTFVRLSRSHNGAVCIIDQGLGVVSGEANRLYKEIFELTQYSFFFNSSENDINKIEEMMSNSGRPLSQVEHRFIARAKQGECLTVCSA
jgi:type IV secretory pathway VirB4 component